MISDDSHPSTKRRALYDDTVVDIEDDSQEYAAANNEKGELNQDINTQHKADSPPEYNNDSSSPEVIDITGDVNQEGNIEIDPNDLDSEEEEEVELVDESGEDYIDIDQENQLQQQQQQQLLLIQLIQLIQPQQKAQNKIPMANEFDKLAKYLMKPIPDYPVKEEIHFVWEVTDWALLSKEEKIRSPKFKCGDYEWNILLFPNGNNTNANISAYMEPHPLSNETTADSNLNGKDSDWYVCAQFAIDVWNPEAPESHSPSQSSHRFSKTDADWGFSALIDKRSLSLKKFANKLFEVPILENNKLNFTGFVRVIDDSLTGVLWHNFNNYDSKTKSGYVGLNNQGATCYLNSLLQSYFTTKIFRKLVYQIPTQQEKNAGVALALQRIFYLLSTSKDPVGTMELTKSFGWDSSDAFTQHDVQELNRILMDKLEHAMKGSAIEKGLNDIFVGKMKSYIKCVNVPYESSRVEDFWDIQLNVKGFRNLEESFKNYIEIEMLEGENKYQAGDDYGYQDAKKGVVFESFPPVLHLQLKRFEYDFMVDDLVKIDDFYEFPDRIDLKPYLDEDLPQDVKNQNWNYKLHGVLVHQGTISNGHYYAMIKPHASGKTWLRFDDDRVWKVTQLQVFQENFGASDLSKEELSKLTRAEQQEHLIKRVTSAYMLVYYRESELDQILPIEDDAIEAAIPDHVSNQIKYEMEERERIERERREALFYTNVKIVTTSTINSHLGFDLALDPTVENYYESALAGTACDAKTLRVRKDSAYADLVSKIAESLGYEDASKIRLVVLSHRENHTNRLDVPVEDDLQKTTIGNVIAKSFNRRHDEHVFFVEELNKDIRNINKLVGETEIIDPTKFDFDKVFYKIQSVGTATSTTEDDMKFQSTVPYSGYSTIFIKYFDPVSQELRCLSYITVRRNDKIETIVEPVKQLLGFSNDVELEAFEELCPTMIEPIDLDATFDKQELNSGDIITFQVSNVRDIAGDKQFTSAKAYYKFMATRVHIRVKPFNANMEDEDSDYVENDKEDTKLDGETEGDNINGQENDKVTQREIELAKKLSKSFDLWISKTKSYHDLAEAISKVVGCDPEFLKIFLVGNQGQKYPLKTIHMLSQVFSPKSHVDDIYEFEYEILNIKLKDYESLRPFKVYWLSNLLQFQVFELLVKRSETVRELVSKLLHKVKVPESQLKFLLCWSGVNHSFSEILKFDFPINEIAEHSEIYCGLFPAEVKALCDHDIYKCYIGDGEKTWSDAEKDITNEAEKAEYTQTKTASKSLNLITVFHFHKSSSNHHGIPFMFIVFPGESFKSTRERLRLKLGLGKQAFDKIRFALADLNNKGQYLDDEDENLVLFDKVSIERSFLALDHPDRNPKRVNPFDKGISIK